MATAIVIFVVLLLVGLFLLPAVAYLVARAVVIGIMAGKRNARKLRSLHGDQVTKEEKRRT